MDARGATADQIWDAITKPEFTSKYFYGSLVETTGETGAPICYYSPDRSERWTDEVVIDSERPHRLVMGWRSLYDPELAAEERSRVTWEIEEQPGGVCKLTVIQRPARGRAENRGQRVRRLDVHHQRAENLVETGEPLRLGPPIR